MRWKIAVLVALMSVWGCSDDPDVPQPVDPVDVGSDGSLPDVGLDADPDVEGDIGTDVEGDVESDAGADVGLDADPDADIEPLPDFEWPVETAPVELEAHESWKERITYWEDPFIQSEYDRVGWVKFTVLVQDPSRVIYQNSHDYPYHYDFATERLAPYLGLSRPAFDALSLFEADQE